MAKRRTNGRISDDKLARYGAATLVGFLVIGGALVLGSVVFGGSPSSSKPTSAAAPSPSVAVSATPVTATDTPTVAAIDGLSAQSMTDFVTTYLRKVADSPPEAWIMLSPDFQKASGGFAAYSKFWGRVALATPTNVVPDPASGTVTYDVAYVYANGTTGTDHPRLTLTSTDGKILIANES